MLLEGTILVLNLRVLLLLLLALILLLVALQISEVLQVRSDLVRSLSLSVLVPKLRR